MPTCSLYDRNGTSNSTKIILLEDISQFNSDESSETSFHAYALPIAEISDQSIRKLRGASSKFYDRYCYEQHLSIYHVPLYSTWTNYAYFNIIENITPRGERIYHTRTTDDQSIKIISEKLECKTNSKIYNTTMDTNFYSCIL
ncbi:uncharacterized protein LOC122537756 [Frieseomelitta varia]|uniref:uncharacterized protein LOC122537756 n=1 Tax=Frieseomelitta varia TaxID=561572 RepID=UPI001CB699B1|nr:uncharacterized protein LOC122537756 [Frieseomelitta varia]